MLERSKFPSPKEPKSEKEVGFRVQGNEIINYRLKYNFIFFNIGNFDFSPSKIFDLFLQNF